MRPDPSTLSPRPSPFLVEVREVTPTRIGDGQVRHSDSLWVRASAPLPDDPLVHACAVAYVSDLGSGFGQVDVPDLPAGGPSIDHSLWFHEPIRADEWMLLELWPLKASGSRGVYSGSLRSGDGRLGVLLTQEMLLARPQARTRDAPAHRRVPRRHARVIAAAAGVPPPSRAGDACAANNDATTSARDRRYGES